MENDFWNKIKPFPMTEKEMDASFTSVLSRARRLESVSSAGKRRAWIRRLAAWSAAAVLLVGVPFYSALKVHQANREVSELSLADYREFSTRNGEIRDIVLPDGSSVKLNAGSVLIYPEKFSDVRSVYLSGEAVFDVTASREHPFVVKTSDINVKVHGTRFNVSAYSDDDNINVTLCRGAVSIVPRDLADGETSLVPDQNYCYSKETRIGEVTHVNASESTVWETGDLFLKAQDIHSVAKVIGRRFAVNIYVASGKYDRAVITARFVHGETLEEQLKAICSLVPGMRYTVMGDNVYLR